MAWRWHGDGDGDGAGRHKRLHSLFAHFFPMWLLLLVCGIDFLAGLRNDAYDSPACFSLVFSSRSVPEKGGEEW